VISQVTPKPALNSQKRGPHTGAVVRSVSLSSYCHVESSGLCCAYTNPTVPASTSQRHILSPSDPSYVMDKYARNTFRDTAARFDEDCNDSCSAAPSSVFRVPFHTGPHFLILNMLLRIVPVCLYTLFLVERSSPMTSEGGLASAGGRESIVIARTGWGKLCALRSPFCYVQTR
jgi:hypothetical protein